MSRAGYAPGQKLVITLDDKIIPATFAQAYDDVPVGDWLALISPEGMLEIARNMESAAKTADASAGDALKIRAE